MLANTCRRLRSRIGRVMEAGVNLLGRAGCRYTKEQVCKISGQYIRFHRSYDSFCNVRTFVLIYRPHPVYLRGTGKPVLCVYLRNRKTWHVFLNRDTSHRKYAVRM